MEHAVEHALEHDLHRHPPPPLLRTAPLPMSDHRLATGPDRLSQEPAPPEVPSVPQPGHGAPAPAGPPEVNPPAPAENPVPVHEIPGMPPMTS